MKGSSSAGVRSTTIPLPRVWIFRMKSTHYPLHDGEVVANPLDPLEALDGWQFEEGVNVAGRPRAIHMEDCVIHGLQFPLHSRQHVLLEMLPGEHGGKVAARYMEAAPDRNAYPVDRRLARGLEPMVKEIVYSLEIVAGPPCKLVYEVGIIVEQGESSDWPIQPTTQSMDGCESV